MSTEDLAEAVCLLVERREASRGQIFNVGNPDNDVSIKELAVGLRRFGRTFRRAPARLRDVSSKDFYGEGYDDSERRVPDISKARTLLGWAPRPLGNAAADHGGLPAEVLALS
jgi:UDP-apiose/xylose synthase